MSPEPISVLVLHRNALFGEGLGRLIGAAANLTVRVVDMGVGEATANALAEGPEAVVLEEGGPISIGDVLERTSCSVLLTVSIGSPRAWRVTRVPVLPDPEHLAREIERACGFEAGDRSLAPVEAAAEPRGSAVMRTLVVAASPRAG